MLPLTLVKSRALLVRARLATAIAIAMTVAACGGAASSTSGGSGDSTVPEGSFHAPDVAINPADKTKGVAPDTVVTVTASGGNLSTVAVLEKGSTTPLAGTLAANHRTWTAASGLSPDSAYTVAVDAEGPGGTATNATSAFTTTGGQHLITQSLPGDGATVGVGEPITLRFNTPIPTALQSALVSRVQIVSTPRVDGDWHWFSDSEVHWRPAAYWPAHTAVTVNANLQGVNAGNGFWGYGSWTSSFTVGDKHVSQIDHNTETMQVFTNDVLVNTIPVSLGKTGFPTLSGTLVIPYKTTKIMMDSCASGIECRVGAANYYKEYVYWDTAVSTDGFFIHAAPWDVFAQGHYDYSHGCINVSEANATWFYNYSIIGDVVVITNTTRAADSGDGEGDWQIPFDQWPNSGGAAPVSAASPTTSGGI